MAKILFVGDMRIGRNSRSTYDGYAQLGHEVRSVDTSRSLQAKKGSQLWWSLRRERKVTPDEDKRLLKSLREATDGFSPDLMVAIKTIYFRQESLLDVPARFRIHQSFDDVSNADNVSPRYLSAESMWDAVVTTKRHNLAELAARGVRNPIFVWGAYDPKFRRRTVPFDQRPYFLGFIGASRPDRRSLPSEFARHLPGNGVVIGPRWSRRYPWGRKDVTILPPANGQRYTAAANSIQLGLVLLNSENRDLHTNRSFETPATGQLVVAERTTEHSEIFAEGEEAIFFGSWDELWENVNALERDRPRARAIAERGFRRITMGRETYADRASQIVDEVLGSGGT